MNKNELYRECFIGRRDPALHKELVSSLMAISVVSKQLALALQCNQKQVGASMKGGEIYGQKD